LEAKKLKRAVYVLAGAKSFKDAQPVEFINGDWYLLFWAAEKKEFTTTRKHQVQNPWELGLGTPAVPYGIRELASYDDEESEAEGLLTIEKVEDEDTPVVSRLQSQTFDNLAETLAQTDIQPTTMATTTIARTSVTMEEGTAGGSGDPPPPVDTGFKWRHPGNPAKRGGPPGDPDGGDPGGGGGNPGGNPGGGNLNNHAGLPGGWAGKPPKTFTGDRKTSGTFMYNFELYADINDHMRTIRVAYQKVNLCLSYMDGEKVEQWVREEKNKIHRMVTIQGYAKDDEDLWDTFKGDFEQDWEDTSTKIDAQTELQTLSQKKAGGLEEYTATFNALIVKAKWNRQQIACVRLFKDGLEMGLSRAMHAKEVWPHEWDLDEWQKLARSVKRRHIETKQEVGNSYGKGSNSVRENRYYTFVQSTAQKAKDKPPPRRERDPDAMDVDVAEIRRTQGQKLSPEEVKRLKSEGRCFGCKMQGHLSRDCPKKSGEKSKAPNKPRSNAGRFQKQNTSARVTEVESDADTTAKESDGELEIKSQATIATSRSRTSTNATKARSIYTQLQKLPEETREEVLERMLGIKDEEGF
jgi:hypothetical protein